MRFFKSILFVAFFAVFSNADSEYRLNFAEDLTLSLSAMGISGIGTYLYYNMRAPDNIKSKDELLPWDKPLAGRYSKSADIASDVGKIFAVTPLAICDIHTDVCTSDRHRKRNQPRSPITRNLA